MVDARLKAGTLPECFFVTTSGIAEKLAVLLEKRGLKVGYDIQICRFSAIKGDKNKTSPFIEIPQPNYTLGRKAAEELIRLIGSSPGTLKKAENTIKTITVTAKEEVNYKQKERKLSLAKPAKPG